MLAAVLAVSIGIGELLQRGGVADEPICADTSVRTFYARRELRPAWDDVTTAALLRAIEVVPTDRSLRLGDDDPRVLALRKRLHAPGDGTLFDSTLDALVRHFQEHHGIEVDDIVGPETLRELNVPAAERVRQIAVNMERWRWMPEDLGPSYLIVNIAAFRLDAIEGNRSVLSMKTVVGKEYTRTPFFAARIAEVIVNPWWNVPEAAIESDIATGTERAVRLTSPRPVYVLYWTAWVGDDGHLEFHRDHYQRDAALPAALGS